MINILRLLKVELIKIKRTLLYYLCLGAPVLISILMFFIFYFSGEDIANQSDGDMWLFFARLTQTYWGLFFLPLFVTLQSALLAGIEHKNKMWKLLYAQPVRKLDTLIAKYFTEFIVIGTSQFLTIPLTLLSGLILQKLNPNFGFTPDIPLGTIVLLNLVVFELSFLILTLHTWASLKWENFVTSISAGCVATVSGVIVMNSDIASFYPWAMPGLIANHFFRWDFPWINMAYSLGLGIIIMLIGLLDLYKKEVY